MSKYTTFLCINKNEDAEKPLEELKQVEVVRAAKPMPPPPMPQLFSQIIFGGSAVA